MSTIDFGRKLFQKTKTDIIFHIEAQYYPNSLYHQASGNKILTSTSRNATYAHKL